MLLKPSNIIFHVGWSRYTKIVVFSKIPCCCCLVTNSCPTLHDPVDYSMQVSSVLHYLLEFSQIHVH